MATEGDREIARDRAVQRTSKERPPLHLQNLGRSRLDSERGKRPHRLTASAHDAPSACQ